MTGDLDGISRAIGRMEGVLSNVENQSTALFAKFDTVNEEVIEARGALKVLATQQLEQSLRHGELVAVIEKDIKPVLEDFKSLKNQGKGAFFGVSLVSGGFGAGVATLLTRWLGTGLPPTGHVP